MLNKESEKEVKEEFCPSCLVMPLAFVGTGAVAAGGAISKKHQKWKKGLLISGIVTFIFLILLIIYYFMTKKSCNGTCSF
jgi:hypothetical protein